MRRGSRDVTHITLSRKTPSKPSLEFYSDNGDRARRLEIERFPFRIGRSESADLRIESPQVSREHAEIFERGGIWAVRDLGSMNGTQVNGKAVAESPLSDGDILRIAETELTFIASSASQFQRMLTQPIPSRARRTAAASLAMEVAAARALMEATLWQAIPVRLFVAASLQQGSPEATFAKLPPTAEAQQMFRAPFAAGERYRELYRWRAAELAAECDGGRRLFLTIDSAEIAPAHKLIAHLEQVQELLPIAWELGVTISVPTVLNILPIDEIHQAARDHGWLVAFDDFQGNGGQVAHLKSHPPDYLVLCPSMTKDMASARQPRRRLESVFTACQELVIKPLLPHTECAQTIARCQEIGYDLMLQPATPMKAGAPAASRVTV
jgi:pSer/pThr/pTyr-binding forkhead associated (FHA) protein/EAL domain-containing protein (putative c-di-GMP-specific phosphodiesterase class I)